MTSEVWNKFGSASFCAFLSYAGPPNYQLFKLYLYMILIYRLKKCFANTPLAYNPKRLKGYRTILSIWSIINIILHLMTVQTINCATIVATPVLLSMLALDVIATITNAYLFTKPLLLLRKESQDKNGNLKLIAVKQWLLSIIAMVSTIISFICVGLMNLPQVFITSDIIITTLSVIAS